MILDKLLEFDPAGTAVTATAVSTNVIDLGVGRDLGIGDDPTLKVVCWTGATNWGAGTSLNIQIQESVDNSTWYTSSESGLILLAQLTASRKIWESSLAHRPTILDGTPARYMRLNYVVAGSNMTTATIQSELTIDVQANPAYPPGIAINN